MESTPSSRFGFIDAIRGVAACLVMLQHSLYQSGLLGDWPNGKLTGFIPTWLELGETGVVAFFIVSGFVIPLSLEKTANFGLFWLYRALRIYPLYILVFALTFALKFGDGINNFQAFTINFVSHILFIQEYVRQHNFVAGSWTLSLEFLWYILLSTLVLLPLKNKVSILVVSILFFSFAADAACGLGHHFPMGRVSMLVCCVLGLICYRFDQGALSSPRFAILMSFLLATIALNLFIGEYMFPSEHATTTFRMASDSWMLAAGIFFVAFFTRKQPIWRHGIFQFFGRISYSVYLTHGIILYLMSRIALHGAPMILATFGTTISISALTYQFIELPPIRLGHSMKAQLLRRVRFKKKLIIAN